MPSPERFHDRLEIIRNEFLPRHAHKNVGNYDDAFFNLVVEVSRGPRRTSEAVRKAYERGELNEYSAGYTQYFREAFDKIFDGIPSAALHVERFDDFLKLTDAYRDALKSWREAVYFTAKYRDKLAKYAMSLHKKDQPDELSDWPLLAKPEWILKSPFELTSSQPEFFTFDSNADRPPSPEVPGLKSDFVEMRTHLDPNKPNYLTNGRSYRLLDVFPREGGLQMRFSQVGYFDYVNSHELAAAELARAFKTNPTLEQLPIRAGLGDTFDLAGRPSMPGINCLLIAKNYTPKEKTTRQVGKKGDYFWIHQRGRDVLEAQNTIHVVPAGAHQASTIGDQHPERDVQLWRTAVREFLEELFSKKELAEQKKADTDFFEIPEIKRLVKPFLDARVVKTFLLGMGLDPLTLKPEISCAIVVDWPAYSRAVGVADLRIDENYEGEAIEIPLSENRLRSEAAKPSADLPCLPAGAATMRLAADHLKLLIERVQSK